MISEDLKSKIHDLAKSIGLEIYSIAVLKENENDILRISISKDSPDPKERSITIEECQNLSNLLSPMLDVEIQNMEKYMLEVSSPGLERSIKEYREFELSIGEKLEVKLMDKSVISGILTQVTPKYIEVNHTKIDFENIKKAKSVFEF